MVRVILNSIYLALNLSWRCFQRPRRPMLHFAFQHHFPELLHSPLPPEQDALAHRTLISLQNKMLPSHPSLPCTRCTPCLPLTSSRNLSPTLIPSKYRHRSHSLLPCTRCNFLVSNTHPFLVSTTRSPASSLHKRHFLVSNTHLFPASTRLTLAPPQVALPCPLHSPLPRTRSRARPGDRASAGLAGSGNRAPS